jgi:hypothetical protein
MSKLLQGVLIFFNQVVWFSVVSNFSCCRKARQVTIISCNFYVLELWYNFVSSYQLKFFDVKDRIVTGN